MDGKRKEEILLKLIPEQLETFYGLFKVPLLRIEETNPLNGTRGAVLLSHSFPLEILNRSEGEQED